MPFEQGEEQVKEDHRIGMTSEPRADGNDLRVRPVGSKEFEDVGHEEGDEGETDAQPGKVPRVPETSCPDDDGHNGDIQRDSDGHSNAMTEGQVASEVIRRLYEP